MHIVKKLTELFTPKHYALTLDLTRSADKKFSGGVTVVGELSNDATEIILHSKDLAIRSAVINDQPATWQPGKDDELALSIGKKLAAGNYTLAISFEGDITDPMHGIYPCYFTHDGQDKFLLATQLESHYARELFPCIDEPAGKATFNLTLSTLPAIQVVSNTPVTKQAAVDSVLTTTFATTPKMSPYLLAFVTGEMSYKETTNKHGVHIRAYATPDQVKHTDFSLQMAAKTLDFLDDYFGTPYPLAKCDLVALPDFAAGAMENWGLVTFREAAMLVDEVNTAADTKERIATVVAHELAHQWFGDLVTMKWWDDLWLNESFANWMEYYVVDHFYPEWKVWDTFNSGEQQYAFNRDGLASVQVVRAAVNHPDELHSLFDPAIVYAKGACLIRMLQDYLGETAFRDGLRTYMKRHQYGNAVADDLWAALSEVSGKDVKAFMNPWITQSGHPVVSVTPTSSGVELRQQRFYSNPKQAPAHNDTVWPLPLLSPQLDTQLLTTQHAQLSATGAPVMINKNHTGFYHVDYSSELLAHIAKQITTLSVVDRQGLLVDGLALARAGHQSTTDVMALLAHYQDETSYAVWESMSSVIGVVRTIINDDDSLKPFLQKYVARLAQPQFEHLGWERKKGEPYFDELLRPTVIALLAFAEVPAVIDRCLQLFDAAEKPEDIALPELRSIIYAVASRQRGESAYKRLLAWHHATQSADERINLIAGIAAMRDPILAAQATKMFTTKSIKPQDVVYWFIYFMRNRHTRPAAWQWMHDNWGWVKEQFGNSHDYADFPKYSASTLSTAEDLARYKEFFAPKLDEPQIAMVIKQGLEDIEVRVLWRKRDLADLAVFLKDSKA